MISQEEITLVKEIIERVEKIIKFHETPPNISEVDTKLVRIHSVMYVDFLGDLVKSVKGLKELIELSEPEFEEVITRGGKVPLDFLERNMMIKILREMSSK